MQEAIDTTSPGGRLVFHVFAALAEFERDLIRDRTKAGLDTARARGRTGGRPALLSKWLGPRVGVRLTGARSEGQGPDCRRLYEQQDMTLARIGEVLSVSRTTVYRALRRELDTAPASRRTRKATPKALQREGQCVPALNIPLPRPRRKEPSVIGLFYVAMLKTVCR